MVPRRVHTSPMSQPTTLTDEQREFRDVLRGFAAAEIAPLSPAKTGVGPP